MGCFEVRSQVFIAHTLWWASRAYSLGSSLTLTSCGTAPITQHSAHVMSVSADWELSKAIFTVLVPGTQQALNKCVLDEGTNKWTDACVFSWMTGYTQSSVSPMNKVSVQCRTKFPASGNTRQVVKSELTSQQSCDLMHIAQPMPGTGQRLHSLSARARVKCLIHIASFKMYEQQ